MSNVVGTKRCGLSGCDEVVTFEKRDFEGVTKAPGSSTSEACYRKQCALCGAFRFFMVEFKTPAELAHFQALEESGNAPKLEAVKGGG